ncbi:ABC transporter permease [Oceanobacillus neutriphilus]|uniref:ABC transporter permease n=2 Tax=Oceanobacillus neutriphilus TaxID=531815 RepID=A0ABQ2NQT8_9BACI|nr:ABC transporter permease [Oceanobacillus neutriphilus]
MRNTWEVTKIMLKMQYSSGGKHSNTWIYALLAVILIPFFLIIMMQVFGAIIENVYHMLTEVNQESMLLGFVLLFITAILLFFSFITILSAFYFSDDITAYIPLPLHPYQLLIGKAANPLIYNYLISAVIFIPFLFIYGSISSAPILFYVYGFILFIFFPIIPFTIVAIILMFLMRYVNIAKNKDRSKIFMGAGSLIFVILVNVLVRLNLDDAALMSAFTAYIQEQEGLLKMITTIFPPAYFGALSLHFANSWQGLLAIVALLAIFIITALLFIWAGQRFYLKGVRGMSSGSKGNLSEKASHKLTKQRSILKTYIRKEIKIIIRTPAFLMQCVVQPLFFPVFITVILFLDLGEGLSSLGSVTPEKNLFLILFMLSIVMLSINATAFTAISREGPSRKLNLFLPIPFHHLIFAKLLVAYLIPLIPFILITFIGIYVNIPIHILIGWIGISLLYNCLAVIINFLIDVYSPKLHWTDEQELFKGRFTPLFISLGQTAFFGIITLILWNTNMENVYLIMLILLIAVAGLTDIAKTYLKKKITLETLQNLDN